MVFVAILLAEDSIDNSVSWQILLLLLRITSESSSPASVSSINMFIVATRTLTVEVIKMPLGGGWGGVDVKGRFSRGD